MANCAIFNCSSSRKDKYKGISLFKVPGGNDEFSHNWSMKLINIITKDRVVDEKLRKNVLKKKLWICEMHYLPSQIITHPTCKTLVPGSLPTEHLPQKSHATKFPTERQSSVIVSEKRASSSNNNNLISPPSPKLCYKSFKDLCERVIFLKLKPHWTVNVNDEFVLLKKMLLEFVVPQFEIYIQPTMAFVIRVFAWLLPNNHPLYLEHDKSMDNIFISDLINLLSDYNLCAGVNCFGSNNITPHVIQKAFNIEDTSPTQQITYYRPHTCTLIINSSVNDSPCSNCKKIVNNQTVKKVQYLQPAKLKAPLTKTNPHRLKLTVQNLRQENRDLQMKIEQYISKSSVPLSEDIYSDFLNIFTSNLKKNNVPPFMKLFWQEQQKYVQASRNGVRYHPMLIRFCLNLVSKSPSAYEELRYNEKDGTGFLILPSQRRLRDFRNYIKPQRGFNKEIINELVEKTKNFT